MYFIATFYKFARVEDCESLQASIRGCCVEQGVLGIILIAEEGVNATISGDREDVLAVIDFIRSDERFADLSWKESTCVDRPFRKMRVRLKKEIVTMGVPGVDPSCLVGTYVKPKDWNALVADPDVILIDTRNDYEVEIGSFDGAVNPDIQSFGQLPDWLADRIDAAERPRVAMFCTGGIRCEKSTALLRQKGIEEVYHLEGGILKYLEQVPREESLWQGQCFVFDERVSVGHGLEPGPFVLCRGCRRPVGPKDRMSKEYVEGVSCPWCFDRTTSRQKAGFAQRQQQVEIAEDRGEHHLSR